MVNFRVFRCDYGCYNGPAVRQISLVMKNLKFRDTRIVTNVVVLVLIIRLSHNLIMKLSQVAVI